MQQSIYILSALGGMLFLIIASTYILKSTKEAFCLCTKGGLRQLNPDRDENKKLSRTCAFNRQFAGVL